MRLNRKDSELKENNPLNNNFNDLYDPETFRKKGYSLIDQLTEYLDTSIHNKRKVIEYIHPNEEYEYWDQYEVNSLSQFHSELIQRSISLHHPHYIGHQVAVPLPELALLGLTSDLLNNGMGIYEMGAAATAIERWVINTISEKIGYKSENNGFLTSGGTLANLTALLAARAKAQTKYPDHRDWVILVSDQAHFCVERAVVTMGLSMSGIKKIKTDENYQISIEDLKRQYQESLDQGQKVIAVVGCACSTATGTYDDLNGLVSFCEAENLWLHIDGAHGGAVVFSDKYKYLVDGIVSADSVVIDTHKMMLTPALSTAVLFKQADDSYNSFKQKADYLFNKEEKDPHNLAKRTYETTKYMMCIKVYYLLKMYGGELIGAFINRQYDLANDAYKLVRSTDHFEAAHTPMSNIFCFRYVNSQINEVDYDAINQKIRAQLLAQGDFYIVSTVLRSKFYLRLTFMNPLTTVDHLINLLDSIKSLGDSFVLEAISK